MRVSGSRSLGFDLFPLVEAASLAIKKPKVTLVKGLQIPAFPARQPAEYEHFLTDEATRVPVALLRRIVQALQVNGETS